MDQESLHLMLRNLYDDMLPLTQDMVTVAKVVAALGALSYIALRVWQSLARAEPVDVYPLLRPFALGICIVFFPTLVLGTLNTVLSPVVKGTSDMLESQVIDLKVLQQNKDALYRQAMLENPETAFLVSNEVFDAKLQELGWSLSDLATISGMYVERAMYETQKSIKEGFREFLEILFMAAALIIDTIRTFFLIVLSILGPLVFAISVWKGFENTLVFWIMRYVSVYLWLPISDLFSALLARIQTLIIQRDITMLQDPSLAFDSSNSLYVIFMLIGVLGYLTIPTVSSWVIQASGVGAYLGNINSGAVKVTNVISSVKSGINGVSGKLLK
ncbi:conjugative transposon protein TraJ [Myroides sp. LJL119]